MRTRGGAEEHAEKARGARRITEMATAYWQSALLFATNRMDMFTHLKDRRMTAREIAHVLNADRDATERLLDGLVSIDLLEKKGGGVREHPIIK